MNIPAKPAAPAEAAALLAATDARGRFDPMTYEAQRLILQNRGVGGIDANRLVQALEKSPGFGTFDRDTFLKAIDKRLDTPAEQRRFGEALDRANITDSFIERQAERLGEFASDKWQVVQRADKAASDGMASTRQGLDKVANDPSRSKVTQWAAEAGSAAVGKLQSTYGEGTGATGQAVGMLGDVVDLAKLGYTLSTDPAFRDTVVGMARLYAAEVADDPAKPVKDAKAYALRELKQWETGLDKAQVEGKREEYLGHARGVAAVEIVSAVVPVSKLVKFGKAAKVISRITPDNIHELGELLGDARRARHAGGEAAEAGAQMTRGLVHAAREQGQLEAMVKAARATGNVEGLLRSGELLPRELSDIAKLDRTIFDGKVDFDEALKISTDGLGDLRKLTSKQLGDIGEAIHTYDLVKQGYTDIVAIKNNSGHGIDVVGRNPQGALEFFEVKTSAAGKAVAQRGDPEEFVAKRLERAIDAQGHWDPKNTAPGIKAVSSQLEREIRDPNGNIVVNAKWVQLNLSQQPGSPRLQVDKTIEDWVKPADRKTSALLDQPEHPDHALYQQAHGQMLGLYARTGVTPDERCDRLAAALVVQAKADGLDNIQHVELSADNSHLLASNVGDKQAANRAISQVEIEPAVALSVADSSQRLAQSAAQQESHDPALPAQGLTQGPEPQAGHPNHPGHPANADYETIRQTVRNDGRWNEEQSTNIAAQLLNAHTADPSCKRLDDVVVGEPTQEGRVNVFAMYKPCGDNALFSYTQVDSAQAAQVPAERSFAQHETITQQQGKEQQEKQLAQQEQAPSSPRMA